MIALAALLVVVAFLAWDRWQTARMLAAGTPDLRDLIALTDRLCQRLQAPEVGIAEHAMAQAPVWAPPAVAMDDDDAFHASKEDLATRLEQMMESARVAG